MPQEPLSQVLANIPATSKIRGYRYLTCQGGGMKGGGFVGAVEILESMGVMSQFEAVAGSSAGAIFATLVAVGYTAKEIRAEMAALDFRRLQDKEAPGWVESSGLVDLAKGFTSTEKGKESILEQLPVIRQLMQLPQKVAGGLAATEDAVSLAFSNKMGLWKGDALLSLVQRLIARKTGKPNITFKELAALAKMKPGVFRNLILTGSNLTTKEKEYYTAEEWPDMPIMDAVRISASFPGAFMPVTKPILKRKVGPDGKPEYIKGVRVDGGLLENLPDVFNKPPYFQPPDDKTGNPEVLALSFKEKEGEKDEIDSGFDLLKALYKTTMSEAELRKKYGDNIVYIDTKGVGTLDFDAEKEKRDALSDSGWECVGKAFEGILEKEKQANFSDMTLEELLRYKASLLNDPQSANVEWLSLVNDHIGGIANAQNLTPESVQQRQNIEFERIQRMLKVVEKRESIALRDEQLVASCQQKLKELENIKLEQELQIKELNLAMAGFELRKMDFQEKFDRQTNKEWVENLENQLSVIKNGRERTRSVKLKKASLEREYHILKAKFEKHEISELQFNIAKIRLETQQKDLDNILSDLKNEKDKFIKGGVLAYYKRKNDDFMCHFFEELNDEFDRPLDGPDPLIPEKYRFPEKAEDIIGFIDAQQNICENYLKEAHQHRKKTDEELKMFQERLTDFDKRTPTSAKYETLKVMEKELERSIYEKTSFIAKINNYFVSDRPSLKNNIITGVMQFVAFTAFTARVALTAAVAVPTLPWFIYKVVNLVKNYNSDGKAKDSADRYLRAFSMPNLFKLNKLKYLSKVTSDAVAVLDKNYDKADKSEHAHVYKLHQLYLDKTMKQGSFKPEFSDIFPRKAEDTNQSYQSLLTHFKQELRVEEAEHVRRSETQGGLGVTNSEEAAKFPVFRNFETFHEQVKENLQRKGYRFPINPSQGMAEKELHFSPFGKHYAEKVKFEFIQAMDRVIPLLEQGKSLAEIVGKRSFGRKLLSHFHWLMTKKEGVVTEIPSLSRLVAEYVDCLESLNCPEPFNRLMKAKKIKEKLKLPPFIKDKYLEQMNDIMTKANAHALNDVQIRHYVEIARQDNRDIPPAVENRFNAREEHRALIHRKNIDIVNLDFIKLIDNVIQEKQPNDQKPLSFALQETMREQEKSRNKSSASRFWRKAAKPAKTDVVALTEEEIVWKYIEAAKAANLKLPTYIRDRFNEHLQSMKPNEISSEKLKTTVEIAEHYDIPVPEKLMTQHRQHELKQNVEGKDLKETHAAMQVFYQMRHQDKKPKAHKPHSPKHRPTGPKKDPK